MIRSQSPLTQMNGLAAMAGINSFVFIENQFIEFFNRFVAYLFAHVVQKTDMKFVASGLKSRK